MDSLINAKEAQTIEESFDYMRELEEEVQSCLKVMRKKGQDLIVLRFQQGKLGNRAKDMAGEDHYGKSVVKELATRAGMHYSTLYRAMQFASHPQFSGSEVRLMKWMENKKEEKGRITWSYCINWSKKQLPDSTEEAKDKLEEEKDKLEKKAHRLEQQAAKVEQEAEDLRSEAGRRNIDAAEEAEGVAHKAKEVAGDLRRQAERIQIKGAGRLESAEYLEHVRSYPCLVCGKPSTDAHHIIPGGTGTKTHDIFTIPLCREHHQEWHQKGHISWLNKYEVDPWKTVAYLLTEYVTGLNLLD